VFNPKIQAIESKEVNCFALRESSTKKGGPKMQVYPLNVIETK
jgi:hypothetical protein